MVVLTETRKYDNGTKTEKCYLLDEETYNKFLFYESQIKSLLNFSEVLRTRFKSLEFILDQAIQSELEVKIYHVVQALSFDKSYRACEIAERIDTHYGFLERKLDAIENLVEQGVLAKTRNGWYKRNEK